jgi:hypothetical protein
MNDAICVGQEGKRMEPGIDPSRDLGNFRYGRIISLLNLMESDGGGVNSAIHASQPHRGFFEDFEETVS